MMQMGSKGLRGYVYYPSNVDLARSVPDIWQRHGATTGLGPAQLQVDHAEPVQAPQGQTCVNATGQTNPVGQGMVEFNAMLCRTALGQYGDYAFILSQFQIPLGSSDQDRATAAAIMGSYQVNMQLVQARANAQAAPVIAAMKQNWQAQQQSLISASQQAVANIHQIGATATARMNATESANQQQRAGFDQQENNISRQGQGFSNYLLDQSVVQNNNMYGNGTVGHATVWNSQADAMVKSNPNRYEIVNTPNYWKGTDF
jgi:hypothetical protein